MAPITNFTLTDANTVLLINGQRHVISATPEQRAKYPDSLGILVAPEPGEIPRRAGDGFVYGGCMFLPAAPAPHEARTRKLQGGTIPAELHAAVIERAARGETARDIAQWLRDEKQVQTSHASVARLIQRHSREAARARLAEDAPELLADLNANRLAFNSALDTMAMLEDFAIQRLIDGETEADKAADLAIRICHRRATLLDRQLRSVTRLLISPAKYPRATAPRVTHPDAGPVPNQSAPAITRGGALTASVAAMAAALAIVLGPDLFVSRPAKAETAFERPCTGAARPFSDSAPGEIVSPSSARARSSGTHSAEAQTRNPRRAGGAILQRGQTFEITSAMSTQRIPCEVVCRPGPAFASAQQNRPSGATQVGNLRPQRAAFG